MSLTYKKGEIVWAKIQGYSWWPGRITQIKLKLHIKKNRLGKIILQYEKEPLFYITFFPNDSRCKVRIKSISKFIDKYKQRSGETKRKKLKKAIDIATKAYLRENPDLSFETKQKIFNMKLFAKKKFNKFKKYLSLLEEDEEQNGENDIQSFIDSEANEIEIYKKELKDKKNSNKLFLGNKRKLSLEEELKKNQRKKNNNLTMSEEEDDEDSFDSRSTYKKINEKKKKYNKELRKYSDELFRINIEIKRKNNINNIINILDNIENIINKTDFEYDFNITKDLLIILNSYTHYNNETIMNKSLSLHKEIVSKYLQDIFSYDSIHEIDIENTEEINDIINNAYNLCEEIIKELDKIKTEKEKKSLLFLKDKNKILNDNCKNEDLKDLDIIVIKKEFDNSENKNMDNIYSSSIEVNNNLEEEEDEIKDNDKNESKENKENEIINENDNKININNNEPFLKDILNTPNYFSKKIEGQLYPDNFFKDIYLKSNISSRTELLRKKMCLQLYNILKLVLPYCQEDIFKKNIIFLEYLARKNDPLFGNKYMTIINMIYNKIKLEAVKIKNKNKK